MNPAVPTAVPRTPEEIFVAKLVTVTPVEAYKACQCLLYQLSEGDIDKRPLYAALEGALSRIADQIISKLPSYEEAAWG